jgi:formate hydrogenlyase transcriptional activator
MKNPEHGPDLASLRDIVDSLPALIHTGRPDGYLDFFNQRWLEFVGLGLEDLEGWKWTAAVHPDDVTGLVARWRACLASGEPLEFESRVRRADGEYRWMLHHKVAMRDELGRILKWYGSSIDIEDRKRAEYRTRLQEAELRQILELTPQHLGVLGPDGSPLYANHVALEYFGVTLDQWRAEAAQANSWLGRLDLLHPDDREHFLGERENRFLEGVPHQFEARLLRHDGTFRWFLFRLSPLKDERGHITRWYGTATDIDDRKRVEERLERENVVLREDLDKASMFEEIIGHSPAIRAVLARVARVAPTESTVLITGETGTGKELVARAIHKRSQRSERGFVSVNCAAIPQALISSELFGHEKGAFTGALQRRLGRFELAEGGTLFLDEVGELPPETQLALLRVLQEREFERVGGTKAIRADVRVVAATNRDLQAAIDAGVFRSDLFYRLNVFPIDVPALRQRKEDIPVLVAYFVARYASRTGKRIRTINKNSMELLQSYPWPGNIRELQNVVERSVIVCDTDTFSVDESWLAPGMSSRRQPPRHGAYKVAAQTEERVTIEAALAETKGRVSGPRGAATKLRIPASTLEAKIRSLGINKHRFKTI